MGRRPLAQKRQGTASRAMPEAKDPSGGAERQPESSNSFWENAKLQSEKTNPQLEAIESLPKTQTNSADLASVTRAKKDSALSMVRRSQRLQTAANPSQDRDIERIIEEITMSEGEKDEVPLNHEEEKLPEPILMHKSLEDKVNYLLQQFEEQQKITEALKFKVTRDSSPSGSPRAADVRYRNLYFDSQKKIEALADENHQLALKLERALGKLEAVCLCNTILAQTCFLRALSLSQEKKNHHIYENGAYVFSEGLKKTKDMIFVTNFTRGTDAGMNFSSQTFPSMDDGAEAKTTAKRKKLRTSK